jgi:hypothetical protein
MKAPTEGLTIPFSLVPILKTLTPIGRLQEGAWGGWPGASAIINPYTANSDNNSGSG